jgi:ankyrin repeat protein
MIRVCFVILAAILATTAPGYKAEAQTPIEFSDADVWRHRVSPVKFIHTDHFDRRTLFLHDTITLEITVGTDGVVESAHAVNGPKEFFAEAETMERSQRFKPFERDGIPVRATVIDYVRLAPPEQWAPQRTPFPKIKDWASLRMTLSRTTCFGTCASYSVEVRGDGEVTYHGNAFVLVTGEHHSRISRKHVEQLFAKFRQADYFSLKDEYKAPITDNPTETTSIEYDGLKKQVKDYAGSYEGMPDVVGNLENAFDELSGSEKWIKETSETWPSLIAEHWDFRANTNENAELFANVASSGSKELVERFMNAGAPAWGMSKPGHGQRSALESAAARQDVDLVRRVLEKENNIPPAVLFQALRAAARSGNLDLVRLLIEHGADVNGSPADSRDLETVLMAAAQSGKADVVDEILLHHPDVNAKAFAGQTALVLFLQHGGRTEDTEHIAKALVSHGARLDQVDEMGRTPLIAACMTPRALKVLVASGADVNARDGSGLTPLMHCSYMKDAVEALLEAGADPSLQDRNGMTAAQRARNLGSKETADLIDAAIKKKANQ